MKESASGKCYCRELGASRYSNITHITKLNKAEENNLKDQRTRRDATTVEEEEAELTIMWQAEEEFRLHRP